MQNIWVSRKTNKCAGKVWVAGFSNRNPQTRNSANYIENTNATRSLAPFFHNYEHAIRCYNFPPSSIINLDRTGVNTVLLTPQVFTQKYKVASRTFISAEQEELTKFG